MTPDNLLETAVLGHRQASRRHHRPPATRCSEMACGVDNREGESPSPTERRLGRVFRGSATGRRRAELSPDRPSKSNVAVEHGPQSLSDARHYLAYARRDPDTRP